MLNNNTISWKSVNVKSYGIGMHRRFRKAVNSRIHARKFVINRIDITWNKQTLKFDIDEYFAIVDDSPLINEFGYDAEYRQANMKVFDLDDEDNRKAARRINVDGCKYVYCDSLIAIQCDHASKIEELADKGYMLNGALYKAATASPSNEKHATKYYAKITNEVPDEEAIFNKIDKLMGGALSYKLTTEPVNGKDITKANTRIGNYASGMQLLATIDLSKERIAVMYGAISQAYDFDQETKKQMDDLGIEIDNKINDGAGFVIPEKLMEMAENVGTKLTEDIALRTCVQTRWDVVNTKIMAQCRREEDLQRMAEFYGAEFYGNPNGKLVALVDTDGAKMVNKAALKDNNTVINMYVMAVANASGVNSCGQHLIKYMAVNPEETLKLVDYYATQSIDEFVANKFESDDESYSVNGRIMAKLNPEEIYNDAFLMESIYSESWTYAQSMIAKNRMPLDGVYTHMTFDLTYALTNGMINSLLDKTPDGFIEAYSADVLMTYAEEIEAIENDPNLTEEQKEEELFRMLTGTVVKFPSAMPDEYEVIVYKTEKQMKQRIEQKVAALDCNNETKELVMDILTDYVEHAYYGCTIYAPINAMKNKLAGADIDYDATTCDMSEFKFILINQRRAEAQQQPGYMGKCTFIKYGPANRKPNKVTNAEVFTECEDLDI